MYIVLHQDNALQNRYANSIQTMSSVVQYEMYCLFYNQLVCIMFFFSCSSDGADDSICSEDFVFAYVHHFIWSGYC